jgi:hypothetical protein
MKLGDLICREMEMRGKPTAGDGGSATPTALGPVQGMVTLSSQLRWGTMTKKQPKPPAEKSAPP